MQINNIDDYISYITRLEKNLYYRGQKNGIKQGWKIQPTYYRTNQTKISLEQELENIYIFYEKNQDLFENIEYTDLLSILSTLQHHGYPTRLLDITSNPLTALFFALDGVDKVKDKPVIYIIEPLQNKVSHKKGNELLDSFFSGKTNDKNSLLINGKTHFQRIKNQDGDYIAFLQNFELNDISDEFKIEEVSINNDNIDTLIKQLDMLGFSRKKIYPTLDNAVAQEKINNTLLEVTSAITKPSENIVNAVNNVVSENENIKIEFSNLHKKKYLQGIKIDTD